MYFKIFNVICFLSLFINIPINIYWKTHTIKIAVVGKGIKSLYAAYLLTKDNLQFQITIHQYEQKQEDITFTKYDQFMKQLLKQLSVSIVQKQPRIAIWNGISCRLQNNDILNKIKSVIIYYQFYKYGMSQLSIQNLLYQAVEDIKSFYRLIKQGKHSLKPKQLIKQASPNLYKMIKKTAKDYFIEQGIDILYTNQIIAAYINMEYNQGVQINAYAAIKSLFPKYKVLKENVEKLKVKIQRKIKSFSKKNSKVKKIKYENNSIFLEYNQNGQDFRDEYRYILITQESFKRLVNSSNKLYQPIQKKIPTHIFKYQISGKLNQNFFGVQNNQFDLIISSINYFSYIKMICRECDNFGDRYEIIMNQIMEEQLNKYFKGIYEIILKENIRFNKYDSIIKLSKLEIHQRVYYTQSLRSIQDNLESSLIAINLIVNQIKNKN